MFNKIKISIIIPAYNAEDSLMKCINSILLQTYNNLQIIVIDDGSTDNTFNLSESLALKDNRIEVYHTENKGSVAARKFGLELSQGEYIGFVDSDDYIESNMFYALLELMVKHDLDFIHSGYIEEHENKKSIISNFEELLVESDDIASKIKFIAKYVLSEDEKHSITPSIWSKLFKAEFIKKCFLPLSDEQQYGEDFLCLCKCILESNRFMLYKKTMYHYVVKESSLSHVDYNTYMFREIGLWYHLIKLIEDYHCANSLKQELYYFLKRRMIHVLKKDTFLRVPIIKYYFKNINLIVDKSIIIFGAGCVGQDYYKQFSQYRRCNIVAWVDTNWNKYQLEYADVLGIDCITTLICDLIIIAVYNKEIARRIKANLIDMGINDTNIVWEKPGRYF